MSNFPDGTPQESEVLSDGRVRHRIGDGRTITVAAVPTYRMDYLSNWIGSEPGETYEIPVALLGKSNVTGFFEAWNYDQSKLKSYAFHKTIRLTDIATGKVFEDAGSLICERLDAVALLPFDHYKFPTQAVGEGYYENALRSIVGEVQGATATHHCQAVLIPYDTNPHDPNAVRVEINGKIVAHLGRHEVAAYRKQLIADGTPGAARTVPALIAGGGVVDGEKIGFSVLLAVDL